MGRNVLIYNLIKSIIYNSYKLPPGFNVVPSPIAFALHCNSKTKKQRVLKVKIVKYIIVKLKRCGPIILPCPTPFLKLDIKV